MSESTRTRAKVTYRRGSGSVEVELANIQSCLEELTPDVDDLKRDVRELRADRDRAYGMLKVIALLQVLIIGLLIALFEWGLNHMSFHADFIEVPHSSISQPVQSTVSSESHPLKGQ